VLLVDVLSLSRPADRLALRRKSEPAWQPSGTLVTYDIIYDLLY
jgi:hypothetical protein